MGEQDPDAVVAAVTAHVHAHAPAGVRVQVRDDGVRVPAYRIPPDTPAVVAGRAALAEAHPGEDVLLAVIAGTLPCTALFEQVLGVKTLFFSFATADEQHHAPDEFFRVARIDAGTAAWTGLLDRLGETS